MRYVDHTVIYSPHVHLLLMHAALNTLHCIVLDKLVQYIGGILPFINHA